MKSEVKYPDGDYGLKDAIEALSNDFVSEKELCDFIESNIVLFCEECLGVEYRSHVREKRLFTNKSRGHKGNKRIDFLVVTKDNRRIGVECKNPKYTSELSSAIGQCLTYLTLFEIMGEPVSKMCIVASKIEPELLLTIDRFNLPVGFVAIDKSKTLVFRSGSTCKNNIE
jgi:hypothetical protein